MPVRRLAANRDRIEADSLLTEAQSGPQVR